MTKVRRPSRVAAQDQVGLVVQQIAVAGLVLADLPLDVLQRLEPALQALADRHEALELGGEIARAAGLAAAGRHAVQGGWRLPALATRRARAPAGLGVGHA